LLNGFVLELVAQHIDRLIDIALKIGNAVELAVNEREQRILRFEFDGGR